jgi:uncharacterized membrane protein
MTSYATTADPGSFSSRTGGTNRGLAWLYLALAVPLVLFFAVIQAPFQIADDFNHAKRAAQISRGILLQRIGGEIDGGLAAYGHIFDHLYFHREEKVTEDMATRAGQIRSDLPDADENFQNTAQYGPILYLPGAAGLWVGKTFGWTTHHTVLLARILNGLSSAAIAFAALLVLRHGRALAFTTLLLPMSLSAFGSTSQDAPILALSILAAAIVSRTASERRPATNGELALFLAIVVATTMARPSHFALFALLPAIPGWRRRPLGSALLLVGAAILAVALWIVALRLWLMPPPAPEWNVGDQFRIIVGEPLRLPLAFARTLANDWFHLWGSVIGRFGWYDGPMPAWINPIGAFVVLCAVLAPSNSGPYWRPALWSLATFAAGLYAIAAALYMSWTSVGHPTVGGLQGRYLLPLLPLLGWLVPAYSDRMAATARPLWIAVFAFPLVSIPAATWTIMDRYYGSWQAMQTALTRMLFP